MSSSEMHNVRNVNKTVKQTLDAFREVIEPALRDLNVGLRVCATPR